MYLTEIFSNESYFKIYTISLTKRKYTAKEKSVSEKLKVEELDFEESNATNSGSDHRLLSETDMEVGDRFNKAI